MTVSQVLNAYTGYFEKENERSKALKIITWETTRWNTWVMWNLHVTKKGKLKNPAKLIKFDWDAKEESITKEQYEEINKRFPENYGDK
jgi:thiamine kinase-like enzyme